MQIIMLLLLYFATLKDTSKLLYLFSKYICDKSNDTTCLNQSEKVF